MSFIDDSEKNVDRLMKEVSGGGVAGFVGRGGKEIDQLFAGAFHPEFGDLENKKVNFLGVSYRGDVGDTRFTPVETLVIKVRDAGAIVQMHDPFVSFWEELECRVESDINAILNVRSDLVIISAGHSVYKSPKVILKLLEMESTNIYDTIGLLSNEQISLLQEKHKVSVLGRGDL